MRAVGFHFNRSVPTLLDLNGPFLSFIEQPESISTDGSSVTLTGIAIIVLSGLFVLYREGERRQSIVRRLFRPRRVR